jgi:hypothetical protein
MRIHVLTGCRDLIQPEILAPEIAAAIISPVARVAQARWISRECGDLYHDFLQDKPGDRRTAVMAQALKDGFGTRFEPLLILADLLDEGTWDGERVSPDSPSHRRSQFEVLSEILDSGHIGHLQLHGLALPSKADPDGAWAIPARIVPGAVRERIERLRAGFAERMEPDSIGTRVLEVTPDLSIFSALYNNALSNHFARRSGARLLESGWAPDVKALAGAISAVLSDWNGKGMHIGFPLCEEHLESITDMLVKRLMKR